MYYLRSRPAADPIKFTLNKEELINEAGNDDLDHIQIFNKLRKKKTKRVKIRVKVRRKKKKAHK
jgi:hypothetical protein